MKIYPPTQLPRPKHLQPPNTFRVIVTLEKELQRLAAVPQQHGFEFRHAMLNAERALAELKKFF